MTPYIIILQFVTLLSILRIDDKKAQSWIFVILEFLMVLFVGLRYEVGGDWFSYLYMYTQSTFEHSINISDYLNEPLYFATSQIFASTGLEIWSLNLFCAYLSVSGIFLLAGRQENKFLSIAVAFPYLIVIVCMGYTRQSVAIGMLCRSIVLYELNKPMRALLSLIIGVLFHKSLILMLAFPLLLARLSWRHVILIPSLMLLPILAWGDFFEHSFSEYLDKDKFSYGAIPRAAMLLLAALGILFNKGKVKLPIVTCALWRSSALVALLILPFVFFRSTFVDRLLIYFYPLQIVFYSQAGNFFKNRIAGKSIVLFMVWSNLLVWLFYGVNSNSWTPYKTYLFL